MTWANIPHGVRRAIPVALGGLTAWWVSSTTPFTSGADAAVAVGFALMAVPAGAALFHWTADARKPTSPIPTGTAPSVGPPRQRWRRCVPWLAALALLVAVELSTYLAGLGGDRHDFPTLSSLYDTAARSQAAKATLVLAWMALGWGLFHRTARSRRPNGVWPR